MQLNRKRIIIIVMYVIALAYLFSYLPMVKPMSCGCKFRYEGWFWNKGPLIYDLTPGKDGKPVQLTWSIDWHRLALKVLAATIIAVLAFVWIGDKKLRWLEGISNVLNGFAVVLLISAISLIAAVMIYAKVNGYLPKGPWGEWPNNHGPWHYTFFLLDLSVYKLRLGLNYAFISFGGSVIFSILSLIIKPSIIKGSVLAFSLLSLVLYFKYLYWLID